VGAPCKKKPDTIRHETKDTRKGGGKKLRGDSKEVIGKSKRQAITRRIEEHSSCRSWRKGREQTDHGRKGTEKYGNRGNLESICLRKSPGKKKKVLIPSKKKGTTEKIFYREGEKRRTPSTLPRD